MPPKIKVTKEEIINAAVEVVRTNGADAINARTIAAHLNCSTQPIFSNFTSMDELRLDVVKRADALCTEYMKSEMESGQYPAYKANGMAYIRFAIEEKELFKLLYMRDRSGEDPHEEFSDEERIGAIVQSSTGLDENTAKLFHLEMWAYVHGIATMFATGFFNLQWELVSKMLTDAYLGLKKQYEAEE